MNGYSIGFFCEKALKHAILLGRECSLCLADSIRETLRFPNPSAAQK